MNVDFPQPAQGLTGEDSHILPSRKRYDASIMHSLRQIIHAVDIYSRKLRAVHRITGPQLVCLLAIVEHGPVTVSALGRLVHVSPGTLVGILDRLEANGLIHRLRDQRDRRRVHVSITDEGRKVAASAPPPLHDHLMEALAELGEEELRGIARSLERVVELMTTRNEGLVTPDSPVAAEPLADPLRVGNAPDALCAVLTAKKGIEE